MGITPSRVGGLPGAGGAEAWWPGLCGGGMMPPAVNSGRRTGVPGDAGGPSSPSWSSHTDAFLYRGRRRGPVGWSVALGTWPHLLAPSELLLGDALMGSDRVPGVGTGWGAGVRMLVSSCGGVWVRSCRPEQVPWEDRWRPWGWDWGQGCRPGCSGMEVPGKPAPGALPAQPCGVWDVLFSCLTPIMENFECP